MNDDVIDLDARRDGKKPPYRWLTDVRVSRGGKQIVKTTVAYLLDELQVDPETLQLGATGYAIFSFKRGLLKDNGITVDEYRHAVNNKMFNIIGMYPQFSTLCGIEDNDATATLIYIL